MVYIDVKFIVYFFLIVKFFVKFIGFDSQIFPQAASELGQHRITHRPRLLQEYF